MAGKRVPIVPGADRYTAFEPADVHAIKALYAGTADEDQQQRAFRWITQKACLLEGTPYVKGDPHDSSFNMGRQFVGLEITKLVKLNVEELRKARNDGSERS